MYNVTELSNFENYKDEVPVLEKLQKKQFNSYQNKSCFDFGKFGSRNKKKITENENFDFVVMGTKGATRLKETFSVR
jgi:hypothetical protein